MEGETMERLTKRNSDGNVIIPIGRTGNTVESVFNRLAAYEDTGMTPEEIMVLRQPPNDPLTLEELREMDGEPVWVELIGLKRPSAWYLLNLRDKEAVNKRGGFVSLINYGNTWLAYRRKPEEEQHYG